MRRRQTQGRIGAGSAPCGVRTLPWMSTIGTRTTWTTACGSRWSSYKNGSTKPRRLWRAPRPRSCCSRSSRVPQWRSSSAWRPWRIAWPATSSALRGSPMRRRGSRRTPGSSARCGGSSRACGSWSARGRSPRRTSRPFAASCSRGAAPQLRTRGRREAPKTPARRPQSIATTAPLLGRQAATPWGQQPPSARRRTRSPRNASSRLRRPRSCRPTCRLRPAPLRRGFCRPPLHAERPAPRRTLGHGRGPAPGRSPSPSSSTLRTKRPTKSRLGWRPIS
mmetsp:Transcript_65094/g.187100  ORF Transcript_65094/g.187100 Transcript_65094/m.187100 type:complete len:278 (-) Transcript_65094:257-1090(-)